MKKANVCFVGLFYHPNSIRQNESLRWSRQRRSRSQRTVPHWIVIVLFPSEDRPNLAASFQIHVVRYASDLRGNSVAEKWSNIKTKPNAIAGLD
jgi:hypothetical protein